MHEQSLPADRSYCAVYISDAHIGSPDSSYQRLLAFLGSVDAQRLVIVGDLIDIRYSLRKNSGTAALLTSLLAMSRISHRFDEIIYLVGNHDESLEPLVGAVIGKIRFASEITFVHDGSRTLVMHGHHVDQAIRSTVPYWKSELACWLYYAVHWIERSLGLLPLIRFKKGALIRALKERSRTWQAYRAAFTSQAIKVAVGYGVDRVICGHIHWPEIVSVGGRIYANCGDWVENHTALLETRGGELRLCWVDEENRW